MKKWIALVTIVGVVTAYILGYAQLPNKVKDAETKIAENQDNVQQVADTLDKYILKQEAIQETKEKSDEEYNKLLREWIKAVSEK